MLTDKEEGGPTKASWKNYQWHLIERGDKTYLRVQDSLSSNRSNLVNIPYYPIKEKWKIPAKFSPADSSEMIHYENVLDMSFEEPFLDILR